MSCVALEGVGGAGADRPLDAGQRVGLAAALGRVGGEAEVDHDLGRAAVGDEVDAGAAVELVVAGAAVEQVAAVAAVERVVAAQALEVVVAGQAGEGVGGGGAGEHVVVGRGRGRERLVDLDRADVGQAAGGQRAGRVAELAGGAGGQRVGAAQRRVGRGCSRSGTMPLALSWPPPVSGSIAAKMALAAMFSRSPGMLPSDVAAEDVVAVAQRNGAEDIRAIRWQATVNVYRSVASHDRVGDMQLATARKANSGASYCISTNCVAGDYAISNNQYTTKTIDPSASSKIARAVILNVVRYRAASRSTSKSKWPQCQLRRTARCYGKWLTLLSLSLCWICVCRRLKHNPLVVLYYHRSGCPPQ